MKRTILIAATLVSCVCFAQNSHRIIVKLKPGVSITPESLTKKTTGITAIDKIAYENNVISINKLRTGSRSRGTALLFTFPETKDQTAILTAYKNNNAVEYSEIDGKGSTGGVKSAYTTIPNDEFYNRQWGLHNDGSFTLSEATAGADIQMQDAWDLVPANTEIIVAVMDSGLKLNHPEFEGRLWTNTQEIPDNGIDDDGNGYIDDVNGWDFAYNDNIPSDDMGHGTNVTGIIAANGNNAIGYTGINTSCKIMTLKGINTDNFGYYTWWAEAITYAVDNGADVVNLSVGGNTPSSLLQEAIDYAAENNVVLVVSMMNLNNDVPYYPAAYPSVIAVGATDPNDKRTAPFFWDANSGSNYGEHISVVAPGNYIYGLSHTSDTNYDTYWGGTSQAAPAVTGIVSLMKSLNIQQSPQEIKSILESTAEDQVGDAAEDVPGFDIYYGHGRVNAFNALSSLILKVKQHEALKLKVYPNPSDGNITIALDDYPAEVKIYNTLGQLIIEKEIYDNASVIHVNEKGVFFVNIKNQKGSDTAKIIIR